MKDAIYVSIKKQNADKIINGEKNYEFRDYRPISKINKLYMYETIPTGAIKYIVHIGDIVAYPNKIPEDNEENIDFNKGYMNERYAYEIKHVDILEEPIYLKELTDTYNFVPPQSFAYNEKYPILSDVIKNAKVKRII